MSDPIQDAIDAPDDAFIVVMAAEVPDPEMALPRWPSIAEMNHLRLFGEADETTVQ